MCVVIVLSTSNVLLTDMLVLAVFYMFMTSDPVVITPSHCGQIFTFVFVVPGVPFTQVFALDRDNPDSPNAQLRYSLVSQIPNKNNILLFQIDPNTGEISTTEEGNTHTHTCTLACPHMNEHTDMRPDIDVQN